MYSSVLKKKKFFFCINFEFGKIRKLDGLTKWIYITQLTTNPGVKNDHNSAVTNFKWYVFLIVIHRKYLHLGK